MRILLTNDDGIYAPGLRALLPQLRKIGEVVVVAPATEQSAVGHSVTVLTPLLVQEILDEQRQLLGWAVEGRPADCVKLALRELLKEPPDLIVSGLNAGSNAGINILYSGTVAAAIEGAFFRCTSIACSLEYARAAPPNFPRGAELSRRVIEQIIARHPAAGDLFNINIPDLERGPIRGVRTVPQNVVPYVEAYDRRVDPLRRPALYVLVIIRIQAVPPPSRHRRQRHGRELDHGHAATSSTSQTHAPPAFARMMAVGLAVVSHAF